MFCMHCGAKNNDASMFCAKCGSKLVAANASGQQAPQSGGADGTMAMSPVPGLSGSQKPVQEPEAYNTVSITELEAQAQIDAQVPSDSAGISEATVEAEFEEAPSAEAASAPIPAPAPIPEFARAAQPAPEPQMASSAPHQQPMGAAGAPMPGAPQAQMPSSAPMAPAQQGCTGAAWKDITQSKGWVKRVIVLCLLGVVPILNFAVDGYCIRWARELSFGRHAELPKQIFKKREIATGFFALLINLAISIAVAIIVFAGTWFLTGFVSIVSPQMALVLGFLIAFASFVCTLLFVQPAVDACIVRMSVVGYLESGFNVKTVWDSFRKAMGSLIGASLLPRIIMGVISGVVVGILIAITMGILGAAGASAYNSFTSGSGYGYGYGSSHVVPLIEPTYSSPMPTTGIFQMLGAVSSFGMLFIMITYIIGAGLNVFTKLFMYRAVGHWVARHAPEWAAESDEGFVEASREAGTPLGGID